MISMMRCLHVTDGLTKPIEGCSQFIGDAPIKPLFLQRANRILVQSPRILIDHGSRRLSSFFLFFHRQHHLFSRPAIGAIVFSLLTTRYIELGPSSLDPALVIRLPANASLVPPSNFVPSVISPSPALPQFIQLERHGGAALDRSALCDAAASIY